jgi:hypothetical protein
MSIEIHMAGSDAHRELASPYSWLCEESGIRGHARISFRGAETGSTEMGQHLTSFSW